MDCSHNQLTSLDLSENTALGRLHCEQNKLTSLDLSKNNALKELYCFENQLTSMFVSNKVTIYSIHFYQNRIKGAAMDALIATLPTVTNGNLYVIYNENEQNEMTDAQVKAAKAKGWTPNYYDVNSEWQPYPGQESIDAIASPIGETEEGAVFDLSGRRVEKPGKGIFIRNGRKVAAK